MWDILCIACRPIPILVAKVWRINLDYVKNFQAKYFTGENIPIYGMCTCMYMHSVYMCLVCDGCQWQQQECQVFIDQGTVHELYYQIKLLWTEQNSKLQTPLNQFRYQNVWQNPILERLGHCGHVLSSLDDLAMKDGIQTALEGVKVMHEGWGLTLVFRGALQEGDVSAGGSVCALKFTLLNYELQQGWYIHVYVHTCVYMHMYMYMCVCAYTYIYMYMYIQLQALHVTLSFTCNLSH